MERSKSKLLNLIIDFLLLFVVGITILFLFLFAEPFQRGFFCNDESINHPFQKKSRVPSPALYIVGLFLPICTMLTCEFLHARAQGNRSDTVILGYTVPPWMLNAYEKIGTFGFGAATTVLFTDIAKYTIGRLRPHFMQLCEPSINCNLPENQNRYITADQFNCTTKLGARLIKESRLSFPSGHSSFSMYTMLFLAMYIQLRFTWKGSRLLKHTIQFIAISLAWYTAMTRISDYKHHWSDVLAGLTIGAINAVLMGHFVADLFKERRAKVSDEKPNKEVDYETEGGTQHEASPLRNRMTSYGGTNKTSRDDT